MLYVDDLKLYAGNEKDLTDLLKVTENFSSDICMEFGIDKCKKLSVLKGKFSNAAEFPLEDGRNIDPMKAGEFYKYLGVKQAARIDHMSIKNSLIDTYKKRLNSILRTELSAKHKAKAINTFAIPVLTYSFGIIKWCDTDLDKLQRITRTHLTKNRMLHPRSAVERMTLPRNRGGRGIVDLKNLHKKQIIALRQYFESKRQSVLHMAVSIADKNYTPLNMSNTDIDTILKEKLVDDIVKETAWAEKALHGRHFYQIHQSHIDLEASNKWLMVSDIYGETEGFMMAIQDQVIHTRNYAKYIIKDASVVSDICRKCSSTSETIDHITSGCSALAQTEYLYRHNLNAGIVHQKLGMKCKLILNHTPFYKYEPEKILENNLYKLYWDRAIITDRTVAHNRPDIVLIDKEQATAYLIDIAVPLSRNIQQTRTCKLSKYEDLAMEIRHIWKMKKAIIVPMVISSTGAVPHSLHEGIKMLGIDKNTYIEMQKSTIISTCHIVRKFLNLE